MHSLLRILVDVSYLFQGEAHVRIVNGVSANRALFYRLTQDSTNEWRHSPTDHVSNLRELLRRIAQNFLAHGNIVEQVFHLIGERKNLWQLSCWGLITGTHIASDYSTVIFVPMFPANGFTGSHSFPSLYSPLDTCKYMIKIYTNYPEQGAFRNQNLGEGRGKKY